MEKLKEWTSEIKSQLELLYKIYTYSKTSWYAKITIGVVIAYALSPIDLIPDFIPVLGYLDDLLILPIGIYLSLKLVPKDIIEECRELEIDYSKLEGKKILAAIVIAFLWMLIIYLIIKNIIL